MESWLTRDQAGGSLCLSENHFVRCISFPIVEAHNADGKICFQAEAIGRWKELAEQNPQRINKKIQR